MGQLAEYVFAPSKWFVFSLIKGLDGGKKGLYITMTQTWFQINAWYRWKKQIGHIVTILNMKSDYKVLH